MKSRRTILSVGKVNSKCIGRLGALKEIFGNNIHFERMRGSFAENEKYCSKKDNPTFQKFGKDPLGKGGRTDRNELFEWLVEGKSDLEIMQSDFASYNRFRRSIEDYRELNKPLPHPDDEPLEVYLFYGEPGTGKTECAKKMFMSPDFGANYFRLPLGKDFWFTKNALNKTNLLIDDFKSNIQLVDLLQLLDQDAVEVPRKGGFIWSHFKRIIITTNRSPYDWYAYNDRDFERQALFRRFKHGGCFKFEKNNDHMPEPQEIDIDDPTNFISRPRLEKVLVGGGNGLYSNRNRPHYDDVYYK